MIVSINIRRFDIYVMLTALVINFVSGSNPAWVLGVLAGILAGRINA